MDQLTTRITQQQGELGMKRRQALSNAQDAEELQAQVTFDFALKGSK